nr:hypothetical protein [Tanacetum cinerariifolium]
VTSWLLYGGGGSGMVVASAVVVAVGYGGEWRRVTYWIG